MPRTRIADVLAEVFRTYGFDTTSPAHPEAQDGTVHRVDLLAEKDGLDIVVLVHEQNEPLTAQAVAQHARTRTAVGARYALAVTLAELAPDTEDAASETGTLIWDREGIARAIGRAVLLEASGASETHEPPVADLLAIATNITGQPPATHTPPVFAPVTANPPAPPTPPTPPTATTPARRGEIIDLTGETETTIPAAPAPVPSATAPPAPAADTLETSRREVGRGWYLESNPPPPERRAAPIIPRAATAPESQMESGREWFLETNPPPPERRADVALAPATAAAAQPGPEQRQPAAMYAAPSAMNGIPQGTGGADPHTFTPEEGILLAPTVTKEAAAQTAKRQVFTIDNTRLRYHPKRVVHWQVEAFVEGRVETTTLSGTLLVDLAARSVEAVPRWESPRTLRTGTFDVPVEGKPMRMQPEHAQELISESILEETSREVTMQDHDASGDYHITVKRRVRISPEDIQIQDEGIHWYPVWGFTGVNGDAEVDGVTGAVLAQHLKGPKGTTMMW